MNDGIFTELLRNREKFFERIFNEEHLGRTIVQLFLISVVFFAVYGFVMGIYNSPLQAVSSMIKVPVLFYLSLLISYPALFVFNILLGSKLSLGQSLAMVFAAYALIACVLASFAPIALFFVLIGSSYPFLRLLHVAIFGIAALSGMAILNQGFVLACENRAIYPHQGIKVFHIWVIIFAFVGTQLAWNLRPYVGDKGRPFQILRKQESNFYAHIFHTVGEFIFKEHKSNDKPDYY